MRRSRICPGARRWSGSRGSIARAELDFEVAVDPIYGPLHHRLLHGHQPLTARFAEDVVDLALAGIGVDPGVA